MPAYNHMFTIAFSVVTKNQPENVTANELRVGIIKRLYNLQLTAEQGRDGMIEACGYADDSYIEEGS